MSDFPLSPSFSAYTYIILRTKATKLTVVNPDISPYISPGIWAYILINRTFQLIPEVDL